jgi:hypothetical protein
MVTGCDCSAFARPASRRPPGLWFLSVLFGGVFAALVVAGAERRPDGLHPAGWS